jgi:hypothetical protein
MITSQGGQQNADVSPKPAITVIDAVSGASRLKETSTSAAPIVSTSINHVHETAL